MAKLSPAQESQIHAMAREWGLDRSVRRAVEELAELSLELLHYRRGRGSMGAVRAEMADVKIALKHLEYVFGDYQQELDDKVRKGITDHYDAKERL